VTRIALCLDLNPAQEARLRAGLGPARLVRGDLSACEIAFGNPEPAALAAAETLRWLQLESVGFGEYLGLDWPTLGQRLTVTNLAGMFADPAAETGLAGILALYRAINRLAVEQTRQNWIGDTVRAGMHLLTGKQVVLFGRGAINGRLAELLAPFRCTITSFGRDWTPGALDAALTQADVVVATVPDMPGTRGLFGAARFAAMKRGAIFCNLGRGSLVDESALVTALTWGGLGGAVIDVSRDEPLPKHHPFWTMPNTILTQHSGGGTADEIDRKISWFLDNLNRYRDGRPLHAVVDFSKGY
jgi:phosphoglycerate dehydrogenase-like enzyme